MAHEMDNKAYTVKQVAQIAGVTVKTLHHYDAIGLLRPASVSPAGYRLYGRKELERLQQIMFYRELDVPLKNIQPLIDGQTDRQRVLVEQRRLLCRQQARLGRLIQTIDVSIRSAQKGEDMSTDSMFQGFKTEAAWKTAMGPHNEHLKDTYGVDMAQQPVDPQAMNAAATEAKQFMDDMAEALRAKVPSNDATVQALIQAHLAFLNDHGHETTPERFVTQTGFFLSDRFHLDMLESQQTGLAYYLAAAATAYAAAVS